MVEREIGWSEKSKMFTFWPIKKQFADPDLEPAGLFISGLFQCFPHL